MPRVLLVLAYRGEDEASSTLLRVLARARQRSPRLGPSGLARADRSRRRAASSPLTSSATASRRGAGSPAERIADEAGGHPLYLRELALAATESLDAGTASAGAPPDLGILLEQRIDRLDADERRLVDLASTAGRPVPRRIILAAAGPGERGTAAGHPARAAAAPARDGRRRRARGGALSQPRARGRARRARQRRAHELPPGARRHAAARSRARRRFARRSPPRRRRPGERRSVRGDGRGRARTARSRSIARCTSIVSPSISRAQRRPTRAGRRRPRSDLRTRLAAALANIGRSREAAAVYAAAAADAALDAPEHAGGPRAPLRRALPARRRSRGGLRPDAARPRRRIGSLSVVGRLRGRDDGCATHAPRGARARAASAAAPRRARPRDSRASTRAGRPASATRGSTRSARPPSRHATCCSRSTPASRRASRAASRPRPRSSRRSAAAARTDRGRTIMTRALRMTEESDDRDSRAFALLDGGQHRVLRVTMARRALALRERRERSSRSDGASRSGS